jgi:hypothetical protein
MISVDETAGSRNEPHGVSRLARNATARARILGGGRGLEPREHDGPCFLSPPGASGRLRLPARWPPLFAGPLLFHLHELPAAPLAPRPACRWLPLEAQPLAARAEPTRVCSPARSRFVQEHLLSCEATAEVVKEADGPPARPPRMQHSPRGPCRPHASTQTDRLPINKRLPAHCVAYSDNRGAGKRVAERNIAASLHHASEPQPLTPSAPLLRNCARGRRA